MESKKERRHPQYQFELQPYNYNKIYRPNSIFHARQVLVEQYGVSFEKQWRMNKAPVFNYCGVPYDPNYWSQTDGMDLEEIEDSDKKLVHGYFLAERVLHKIEPNDSILDAGFIEDDNACEIFTSLIDTEDK